MWFEKMTNHALKSFALVALIMVVALLGTLLKQEKACADEALDPALVTTRDGAVQGVLRDGVAVFRGIPYATPPVGGLRWKPPQPAAIWEGVRDATAFGAGCPLFDVRRFLEGRQLNEASATLFIGIPQAPDATEDCLYLNVWAPAEAENAAVMVWLQPNGPASMPLFDGGSFARDGVVFVTLDYRQLSLGNFAHPALTAAAGPDEPLARFQTMDQMAALAWVQENIAAFGGDPDNVTIYGESAGGFSVLQLLTIPEAEGLFDKAIVQSGAGWSAPWSLAQMERLGALMTEHAGLPADVTADQLRAMPLDRLPQLGVYSIDGRLQVEGASAAIDAGRMHDKPLLIGWTDFDGSSLGRENRAEDVAAAASPELAAAYAVDGKAGADLGYQMYTDSHVGAPARWIAGQASGGAPSYLYLYTYVASARRGQVRGAAHGDDIPYVFDAWDTALPQLNLSEEDRAATRLMHSCWVSFAKTGAPSCDDAPEWPAYAAEGDALMELGLEPQVRQGFRAEQLDAQVAAWRAGTGEGSASVDEALAAFEEALQPQN